MATRSWNRVELIGNLTRDPEMRYTPQGTAVASFSIATNRTYVSDGEKKEEVDFHKIVAWGKLAEICSQYMKKGGKVFVSGRLQNRSWEGQDGQQRQTTEIVLEDMLLLGSRGGADSAESYSDVSSSRSAPAEPVEDISPPPAEEKEEPAEKAKPDKKKSPAEEPLPKEDPGNLDDLPF